MLEDETESTFAKCADNAMLSGVAGNVNQIRTENDLDKLETGPEIGGN